MRLWSLHPAYLDAKGLVAEWREALLAQKVLQGKTRGYRHHPQLLRFQNSPDPVLAIGKFLREIANEGARRGYRFDISKIRSRKKTTMRIAVSSSQVEYEVELLKSKLWKRDRIKLKELQDVRRIRLKELFRRTQGDIEGWEKVIPEIYRRSILRNR